MFHQEFSNTFNLADHQQKSNYIATEYVFTCTKTQHTYIALVQQYQHDVYMIKFFLKSHEHARDKFKLITNYGNCTRILRTCIDILVSIYRENPQASFGFIGEKSEGEELTRRFKKELVNKRFSLYRRLVVNLFTDQLFTHFQYEKENAYMLLNKANDTPEVLKNIEALFKQYYLLC